MCGIFGSISTNKLDKNLFVKQLNLINHRGPDDQGIWFNDNFTVGLGSKRLSIQDLSPLGHMPMFSNDNRYVIVFNGEIYNFKELKSLLINDQFEFKSNSDTEVVLNSYIKWGSDCLKKLEGMFAIAIFDNLTSELFLARDRVGEKPLYFWKYSGGLSFASELKQLLEDSKLQRELNYFTLTQYLEDGYAKGKNTFIK